MNTDFHIWYNILYKKMTYRLVIKLGSEQTAVSSLNPKSTSSTVYLLLFLFSCFLCHKLCFLSCLNLQLVSHRCFTFNIGKIGLHFLGPQTSFLSTQLLDKLNSKNTYIHLITTFNPIKCFLADSHVKVSPRIFYWILSLQRLQDLYHVNNTILTINKQITSHVFWINDNIIWKKVLEHKKQ